jgi:hypothetical protein
LKHNTFDVSPLVVQTAQVSSGNSLEKFDRPAVSAWAWRLIERGLETPELSVLANEAEVLSPSELAIETRLAFEALNLVVTKDHSVGKALFLYGSVASAWHDDRELECAIMRQAGGDFEAQPLCNLALVLNDLKEFGYANFHKDSDMNEANQTEIVRRRCTEWLGLQGKVFCTCVSSYMALENQSVRS